MQSMSYCTGIGAEFLGRALKKTSRFYVFVCHSTCLTQLSQSTKYSILHQKQFKKKTQIIGKCTMGQFLPDDQTTEPVNNDDQTVSIQPVKDEDGNQFVPLPALKMATEEAGNCRECSVSTM